MSPLSAQIASAERSGRRTSVLALASYTRAVPPLAIGSPLPVAEDAIVARRKLERYVLDPSHADGRHKARVFRSALGIAAEDWRYLRDAILAGVREAPVSSTVPTPYGLRCTVVMPIQGINGQRHDVLTAWLVKEGTPPRLVTAYVNL